jgi:putative Mn2+ efflux pump MntP
MTLIEILFIAAGTSMAPFSVGVTHGAIMKRLDLPNAMKMGLFFGGAHALLLLLGWLIGVGMRDFIASWDHWVVFGLLAFLGGEMIVESFSGEDGGPAGISIFDTDGQRGSGRALARGGRRPCYGYGYAQRRLQIFEAAVLEDESRPFETGKLGMLSLALSLDALAIGLAFSMTSVPIVSSSLIIGAVVFTFTLLGFPVGAHSGEFIKNRIGILGGLVLIGIGLRVLLEHVG